MRVKHFLEKRKTGFGLIELFSFCCLLIKDGLIHQKGCYSGSPLLNWPLSPT